METPKPRVTAKDFFMWLSTMVFLYGSAVSFIALSWSYIDTWFPDSLDYQDPYTSAIRFAIAALVVVFPIFVVLTRILHEELRKNPEKRELWVRRWLIFLTLFFAGITIAVDLVVLINRYLQGDLTLTFGLKAAVILAVIGGVFAYYLYELKGTWESQKRASEIIAGLVSLLVLASVVGAFFIVGSPETARLLRIDDRKAQDLQMIQSQVISFYQQKGKLPANMEAMEDPLTGFTAPVDPDTGAGYVYRIVKAPYSFDLCATFNRPSRESETAAIRPTPVGGIIDENWTHAEGEVCFSRTIDPELIPITKTPLGF